MINRGKAWSLKTKQTIKMEDKKQTWRHSAACSMSICLVDCMTSAKEAGVGSPSCNVPGYEAEVASPSTALFVAAA